MVGPAVKELNTKGGSNKFKFSSFQDQITRVKVDLIRSALPYHSSLYDFTSDETEFAGSLTSFFISSFAKWRETNLTADFKKISQQLVPISESLAQLLYHRSQIVDTLLENSSNKNAAEAVFELLESLAKDLQDDLYPEFERIFKQFNLLLHPEQPVANDAKITQKLFNCMAAYLKVYTRKLTSDAVDKFSDLFMPFLYHSKVYIRQFGAEAIGYLLRKLSSEMLRKVLHTAYQHANTNFYHDGLRRLLFETLKGANKSLQSKSKVLATVILETAAESQSDHVTDVLAGTWTLLLNHVSDSKTLQPVEEALVHALQIYRESKALLNVSLVHVISYKGHRVSNWHEMFSVFEKIPCTKQNEDIVLQNLVALIYYSPSNLSCRVKDLFSDIAKNGYEKLVILALHELKYSPTVLSALIMPFMSSIIDSCLATKDSKLLAEQMHFWNALPSSLLMKEQKRIEPVLASAIAANSAIKESQLVLLETYVKLFPKASKKGIKWDAVLDEIKTSTSPDSASLVGRTFDACLQSQSLSFSQLNAHWFAYFEACTSEHQPFVLMKYSAFLAASAIPHNDELLNKIKSIFLQNITSSNHSTRLFSLDILRQFEFGGMNSCDGDSKLEAAEWKEKRNPFFELLHDSESIYPNQVSTHRSKMMPINKIAILFKQKRLSESFRPLFVEFLSAQFMENFSPLWNDVKAVLKDLTKEVAGFRKIVFDKLFNEGVLHHTSNAASERKSSLPVVFEHANPAVRQKFAIESDSGIAQLSETFMKARSRMQNPLDHFKSLLQQDLSELPYEKRLDYGAVESNRINCLCFVSGIVSLNSDVFIPWALPKIQSASNSACTRAILEVISMLHTPQRLHSSEKLYAKLLELLAVPDEKTQKAALSCILMFRNEAVLGFKEQLFELLTETQWRSALLVITRDAIVEKYGNSSDALYKVLASILYSRLVSRKRNTNGKFGAKAQRVAVLQYVAQSEPKLMQNLYSENMALCIHERKDDSSAYSRKLLGYLTLLESIFGQLGARVLPLLPAIYSDLFQVFSDVSSNQFESLSSEAVVEFSEQSDDDVEGSESDETVELASKDNADESNDDMHLENGMIVSSDAQEKAHDVAVTSAHDHLKTPDFKRPDAIKILKRNILKAVVKLYRVADVELDHGLPKFTEKVYSFFIVPRLELFVQEHSQAPGALLLLFKSWSDKAALQPFLLDYDDRVIPKLCELVSFKYSKRSLIRFTLSILDQLSESRAPQLVKFMDSFLANWTAFFAAHGHAKSTTNTQIRLLEIFSRLCEHWTPETDRTETKFAELLVKLLSGKTTNTNDEFLVSALKIIDTFLPNLRISKCTSMAELDEEELYMLLLQLTGSAKGRRPRQLLAKVLSAVLSKPCFGDNDLGSLITDMNQWSRNRMDEPDFEKRFIVFQKFQNELCAHEKLSAYQLQPLLHSFLFFISDTTDYSTRSGAQFCLQRIVEESVRDKSWESLVHFTIIPAIKRAFLSHDFNVRQAFLELFGYIVATYPAEYESLTVLLAGGDPEANFFQNIHHLQIHRRIRAMNRLVANSEQLSVPQIGKMFIPLFLHFVYEMQKVQEQALVNEAITAIGTLSSKLSWSYYSRLLASVTEQLSKKPWMNKRLIRLLISITDNFVFSLDNESIRSAVTKRVIPCLYRLLLDHSENSDIVELRVPVAISVANLIAQLPSSQIEMEIPKLVGKLGDLLKSRIQQIRDITRTTLKSVVKIIGLEHLPQIISLLKYALKRGPQVHVLIYTVHSLLVLDLDSTNSSIVDRIAELTMSLIVNDVFGVYAEEKEVEALQKTMIERQGMSKGFSIVEVLAEHISLSKLDQLLLKPIEEIMAEASSLKIGHKLDQLLHKCALGLSKNKQMTSETCLQLSKKLLAEQLIFNVESQPKPEKPAKQTSQPWDENYLVQMKRPDAVKASDVSLRHYKANSHRLVQLGLTLLSQHLSKVNCTALECVSEWESLVNLLGELLYSQHEGHVVSAMQVLSYLLQSPQLVRLQSSAARQAITSKTLSLLSSASTTDNPVVQTAFRLLAGLFRSNVELKPSQMSHLLMLLELDLNHVSRQKMSFSLLKALVKTRTISDDLYRLMDTVRDLSVSSSSAATRELARQSMVQFMLDCPQSNDRVRRFFQFLSQNLQFEHSYGRHSDLKLIELVLKSFSALITANFLEALFLPLLLVACLDEDKQCRELGMLILREQVLAGTSLKQRVRLFQLPKQWLQMLTTDCECPMSRMQMAVLCSACLNLFVSTMGESVSKVADVPFEKLLKSTIFALDYSQFDGIELRDVLVSQIDLAGSVIDKLHRCDCLSESFVCHMLEQFATGDECEKLAFLNWFGKLSSGLGDWSCWLFEQPFSRVPSFSGKNEAGVKIEWLISRHFHVLGNLFLTEADSLQAIRNLSTLVSSIVSESELDAILGNAGKLLYTAQSNSEVNSSLVHQLQMSLLKMFAVYMQNKDADVLSRQAQLLLRPIMLVLELVKASASSHERSAFSKKTKGALLSEFDKAHAEMNLSVSQALSEKNNPQLESLATQLLDMLKRKVGTSNYLKAYEDTHNHIIEKRQERKVETLQMAVSDPKKFHQRKLARNELKRKQKHRKVVDSAQKKIRLVNTVYNVNKHKHSEDLKFEDF